MANSGNKTFYRVAFLNQGKVYELFCTGANTSHLLGFVEFTGLQFEHKDSLVVDPTEEKMRDEFEGVEVLHLPMHSVLRVEQVLKKGQSVIRDRESGEKIMPFPIPPGGRSKN